MITYGTQYYRPPFPERWDWKNDLLLIKESNFNTVKLWAVWSWIERKEGEFFFSDLDELVDLCEQAGLNVVINTIPEGMPYWAARRHSDARYKTGEGQCIDVSGAANMPSGGSPGVCPDKDEVQTLICRFINRVVSRYSAKPHVIAFDVWNEPHIEPIWDYPEALFCYCPHSQAEFIRWLKGKYSSLEHLNQAWMRAYSTWDDVLPPVRFGTYADMIDWRSFWIENLARWLEARVSAARAVGNGKTIMTHVPFSGYIGGSGNGGLGQHLGDEFILARAVDKFGVTSFPKWLMQNDFVQHLANLELAASASAAAGKEFWQSELQSGAGKWEAQGKPVATPEEIRLWNWSAVAAGAKGVLYWQWRPEPSGTEAPGFGLTTIEGKLSARTKAAADCASLFNRVPGFDKAGRVPPVNGIYVSRNTDLYLHAANRGERLYAKGLYAAYKACFDSGIPVRMVHADEFQNGLPNALQILYVPLPLALSDQEQARLRLFVECGGSLVMEACPGLFTDRGILRREWDFLREVFGLAGIEVDHVDTLRILVVSQDRTAGPALNFSGKFFRQDFAEIHPGVTILARFEDGRPAVTESRFGKGRAILVGSSPSLAFGLDGDAQSAQFISGWMDKDGYPDVRIIENKGKIFFRMHRCLNQCYITIVNYSILDHELKLELKPGWTLDGDSGSAKMKDGLLDCRIPKKDGAILRLTRG